MITYNKNSIKTIKYNINLYKNNNNNKNRNRYRNNNKIYTNNNKYNNNNFILTVILCLNIIFFSHHNVIAGSINRNLTSIPDKNQKTLVSDISLIDIQQQQKSSSSNGGSSSSSSSNSNNNNGKETDLTLKSESKIRENDGKISSASSSSSSSSTSTDHVFAGFGNYGSEEFEDENYDEEETFDSGHHYSDKTIDTPDYKSNEYEERQLSSILDGFGTKFDGQDTDNSLPIFLIEPQSTYVVKNRPAILKCKAAHALQLSFKCSGSSQPPPSSHESHVDPHSGVHLEEVTATISRDLVDEYFGKGPFKCDCHAWSSRGGAKSQVATVEVAYIRKQFVVSPQSVRVEVGGKAELHCTAPNGLPTPKIYWYKNNVQLLPEHPVVITPEGSLHIAQVSLQDMANYTCIAENIAGKRISETATISVYVNGGWSAWSPWMECKCPGKASQGKKRTRSCSNPIPLNGGAQCEGPNVQKTPDCIPCPEDTQIVSPDSFESSFAGRWSPWSEWSSCSVDCIQIRRRKCITHTVDDDLMGGSVSFSEGYDKSLCSGKDFQTAECRGGNCRIGKDDSDWPLYLGLTIITAVCVALGAALVRTARRGRHIPPYNMTRTVMQSDYLHDPDKKAIHFHNDTNTANYEYPSTGHRSLNGGITMTRSTSEHHYDVPNLASNYTTPIDGISSKYSYATDTADTSTNTSDSTYDVASEPPTLPMPPKGMCKLSTTRDVMTSIGGFLRLYGGQTMLYIPDMAVGKNLKHTLSLSILSDECSRIITSDSSTYLSPVVYCGPIDLTFHKPIILKIPHCMIDPTTWNIHIYYSDCFIQESNVKWRKIATVGEETINTPVFVQIDHDYAYIMTEQLGRFVIIGEPLLNDVIALKKMKLIVFGQITPTSSICSLRVYIVDDYPNCRDMCTRIESQLGGTFMGESATFVFHLNNMDFKIHLNCIGEWQPPNGTEIQIIPYNHMLNSSSILHCEFSLQRNDQPCIGLKLEINYSQSDDIVDTYMFVVPYTTLELSAAAAAAAVATTTVTTNNAIAVTAATTATTTTSSSSSKGSINSMNDQQRKSKHTTTIIDKDGTYISSSDPENDIRLPRNTKRLLCSYLDPPRSDGNDWRLLAQILMVDHYIAYFATKPSPTEQILNLWECRCRGPKAILDLITAFKDMRRQDVVDIIEQSVGPLWF